MFVDSVFRLLAVVVAGISLSLVARVLAAISGSVARSGLSVSASHSVPRHPATDAMSGRGLTHER